MVTKAPETWAADLDFAGIERRHGLPAGILTNLVRKESGGNCYAKSPVGAYGLCQFMPATARERGVNASDPKSSAEGAAKYLEDLMDMFGGDVDKAIAAYNWGQGNLRKAIRKHGDNWRTALPDETRDYLKKVGSGIGRSYTQRRQAGEVIPAEEEAAEVTRRNGRLEEAGLPEMSVSGILGSLFFAVIASFLEKKLGAAEEKPLADASVARGVEVPRTPDVKRPAPRSPALA